MLNKEQFKKIWNGDIEKSVKHPINMTWEEGFILYTLVNEDDFSIKERESNPYSEDKILGITAKTINSLPQKDRDYSVLSTISKATEFLLKNLDKHQLKEAKLKEKAGKKTKDIDLSEIREYLVNNPLTLQKMYPDLIKKEETDEETK